MRVAAAGALLLTTILLPGCGEESAEKPRSAAAPDGMRWVGMNDVVVAVPDWWSTGETRCLAPV